MSSFSSPNNEDLVDSAQQLDILQSPRRRAVVTPNGHVFHTGPWDTPPWPHQRVYYLRDDGKKLLYFTKFDGEDEEEYLPGYVPRRPSDMQTPRERTSRNYILAKANDSDPVDDQHMQQSIFARGLDLTMRVGRSLLGSRTNDTPYEDDRITAHPDKVYFPEKFTGTKRIHLVNWSTEYNFAFKVTVPHSGRYWLGESEHTLDEQTEDKETDAGYTREQFGIIWPRRSAVIYLNRNKLEEGEGEEDEEDSVHRIIVEYISVTDDCIDAKIAFGYTTITTPVISKRAKIYVNAGIIAKNLLNELHPENFARDISIVDFTWVNKENMLVGNKTPETKFNIFGEYGHRFKSDEPEL